MVPNTGDEYNWVTELINNMTYLAHTSVKHIGLRAPYLDFNYVAQDGSFNSYLLPVVEGSSYKTTNLWINAVADLMERGDGTGQYICEKNKGSFLTIGLVRWEKVPVLTNNSNFMTCHVTLVHFILCFIQVTLDVSYLVSVTPQQPCFTTLCLSSCVSSTADRWSTSTMCSWKGSSVNATRISPT